MNTHLTCRTTHVTGRATRMRRGLIGLLLFACLSGSAGCHRAMYRRRADHDAYDIVGEKSNNPHWDLTGYSINIDSRSRLFDPTNPDCSPMPPDDPEAHKLMHVVDHKKGWPLWHRNGDTPFTENPDWLAFLPLNEDGELVLDSDDAVRTARMHSRNFQQELEDLYLSALDVSFERFRFDAQFFAGYRADYTAAEGISRVELADTQGLANGATAFPRAQMRKFGTTGTDLLVSLVNSIVWDFSGPDSHLSTTLLDVALLQPLLRNAGRERVLERLTLAERTLLSNVRSMERYRQGFYVQIMTGRDPGQGPQRRGGVFTANVVGATSPITVGAITAPTAAQATGAGQAGGYLGLLQGQQDIRNQEFNVASLRINLRRLREALEAVRRTQGIAGMEQAHKERLLSATLQVAQAQQALYNAESRLLNAKYDYQTLLDAFKVTLGLPPQVPLTVQDPIIEPLRLLRLDLLELNGCLNEIIFQTGRANDTYLESEEEYRDEEGRTRRRANWSPQLARFLRDLLHGVEQAQQLRQQLVDEHLPDTAGDIDRLKQALPQRVTQLKKLRTKLEERTEQQNRDKNNEVCDQQAALEIEPEAFNVEQLEDLPAALEDQHAQLLERVGGFGEQLGALQTELEDLIRQGASLSPEVLTERIRTNVLFQTPQVLRNMSSDVLNLMLIQARARVHSVQLPDIELDPVSALDIARTCRHDWMNARTSLVDAWRLIEFNADQLQGAVDLYFAGQLDYTNSFDKGAQLLPAKSTDGRIRVGVQFEAPLTRLAERNVYRQSLIDFQQTRRSYYNFVDQVAQGLRRTLRTAEANQLNFEARRLAVLSAVEQVIVNDAIQSESQRDTSNVTAARDSVTALTDLLTAQNDFLSVWISYQVLRRSLDYDLGTMQLDTEGIWVDPGTINAERGAEIAACLAPVNEILVYPDSERVAPVIFEEEPADEDPADAEPIPAGRPTNAR